MQWNPKLMGALIHRDDEEALFFASEKKTKNSGVLSGSASKNSKVK